MADADSGVVYTNDGQVLGLPAGTTGVMQQPDTSLPPADTGAWSGTPAQAKERLAQFHDDPKLRDAVLSGQPALLREWRELNRVVVEAGSSTPTGHVETTDSVSDPNAVTRREYAGLIDVMRDQGMPDRLEAWLGEIEAGRGEVPSEGDGVVAHKVWNQLIKNPEYRAKVLNSDPQALQTKMLLSTLKAFAARDGKPISPVIADWLQRHGLR
jgi:hypothetical protein